MKQACKEYLSHHFSDNIYFPFSSKVCISAITICVYLTHSHILFCFLKAHSLVTARRQNKPLSTGGMLLRSRFHCFTHINYSPVDIMKNNDREVESRPTDTCSCCCLSKKKVGLFFPHKSTAHCPF